MFAATSASLMTSSLCMSPIYKPEEHAIGKDTDTGEGKHKPLGLQEGRRL